MGDSWNIKEGGKRIAALPKSEYTKAQAKEWYAKYKRGEVSHLPDTPAIPSQTKSRAFAQGLTHGSGAGVAGLTDLVGRTAASAFGDDSIAGHVFPPWGGGDEALEAARPAHQQGSVLARGAQQGLEAAGFEKIESNTPGTRIAEMAGTGAGMGALLGPSAIVPGLIGTAAGGLGGGAGQAAEEAGLPWWAVMGADVVGGGVPAAGGKIARRTARNIAAKAPAAAVGEKLGVHGKTVQAAREGVEPLLPRAGDRRDDLVGRIDETVESFPAGSAPPTYQAALPDRGLGERLLSRNLGGHTKAMADVDPEFAEDIIAQQERARQAVGAQLEEIRPTAAPGAIPQRVDELETAANEATRQRWRALPIEEMPTAPTGELERAASAAAERAGVSAADLLPKTYKKIADLRAEYGEAIPYTEIQTLRSRLLSELRDPSTQNITRQFADEMMEAFDNIERTIDSVADLAPGMAGVRGARAATREVKETFEPQKRKFPSEAAAVGALRTGGAPGASARKILNSADPAAAARQVKRVFKGDAEGLEMVRAEFWDHLLPSGDSVENWGKTIGDRFADKRFLAVYEELFGPEALRTAKLWEKRFRKATYQNIGGRNDPVKTGTGVGGLLARFGLRWMTEGKVQAGAMLTSDIYRNIFGGASKTHVGELVKLALQDSSVMRDLLTVPGKKQMASWERRMKNHMALVGARLASKKSVKEGGGG